MIIKNHILKISNVYFNKEFIINDTANNINQFINNYSINKCTSIKNKKIITIDNLLVINTLHSCFVHGLIDSIFPIFWAINDIKNHESNVHNIQLFILRKGIYSFQRQNLPLIDSKIKKYKGVYHDIISFITNNYIFEHLIEDKNAYFIKNCYFYILNDKWQRSPWNSINYYPGRNININDVIFSDMEIKTQIIKFRNLVLDKTNNNCNIGKGIILINRRKNTRNINNLVLPLTNILNKFDSFKGIIYLEDLTFQEQVNIFINNNIIIGPHGAGMIHNIWSSNKFVIEITFKNKNQDKMYKRICDITDNHIIQIDYDNILNEIEKKLHYIMNEQKLGNK